MDHLDEPTERGILPTGSLMSSQLLGWVENPWRRHMLRIHLNIVATGSASSSTVDQYIAGLPALAETHNIESADRLLPSIMYVPRIYARRDINETQDARGLEWFTEEQVASLRPSLFRNGLSMPIVSSSFIMQAGAAATVLASETPRDNRWHTLQGPYHMFPLPNIGMREINEDWGMLPLVVPGAHVVAPVNLVQLVRKANGPMPFHLGYASSARMLVENFDAWYQNARETGVLVSIHRLHPRDIDSLVENEIEACSTASGPATGRWLGPFDHFAARETAELLLSSGIRVGTQDTLHESDTWVGKLESAIASIRHHLLTEWSNHFEASWMGGRNFELNPLIIKMGKVVDSLGELGLRRLKQGQDPSFWLGNLEECKGSFAELGLWYGQLSDSSTHQEEVDLASQIGPYPFGRFVSEWGKLPGLKTWLEDADGEVVEVTDGERYEFRIFSNRPSKKVFCTSRCSSEQFLNKSKKLFTSAQVSLTFVEWLKKAEATFEIGCSNGMPRFRRIGGEWHNFSSRQELRAKLEGLDTSVFLDHFYESVLMPPQWKAELQATLIENLGLVMRQWSAPFAPLCVHQFIQAVRETLGFRDEGNWQETLQRAHHLAGAELGYLVDIWWPEAFKVYRTEMSWVIEIDHGVGLVTSARAGDDRIHVAVGFDVVRYACGFPSKTGWSRHQGGLVIGTNSLESLFAAPSSQVPLRLARPHCAADAWASSDMTDLLARALGVTFEFHLGPDGTLPLIELRGPRRRLKSLLRMIPGFSVGGVATYSPPPALTSEERRTGKCWIWTQAQLRGLAANHCAELHEKVAIPWDGHTQVLSRAVADAVVVWGVVQHSLRCSVTGGGEWLPEGRRTENGFSWDQPLELGPSAAVYHSGADVFLLATSDKALQWKRCTVSRPVVSGGLDRARITPECGGEIVAVGSGEKPDGAFQRPVVRVEVGNRFS